MSDLVAALLPDPAPVLRRGLAVFPLPAGAKVAPKGWQHTVIGALAGLADEGAEEQLQRALAGWPASANVGIACRASGVVGIDLDRHCAGGANASVNGVANFADLCRRWGQDRPVTLEVATPHGGRHLIFRVPAGIVVPSVSGGTSSLGRGIDIRGPGRRLGGYLAGPGSTVDGRVYEVVRDVPIAPLPGWLTALIGRRQETEDFIKSP